MAAIDALRGSDRSVLQRLPIGLYSSACKGPIAGSFPILSLRTNKADVIVAVDPDVAKKLDESGEKWRYNGK